MNESRSSSTAAAQTAQWFVDLQGEDISRDQQEAFADWLRRSPVHVEEFLQLTALQGDLARLRELKQTDVAALLSNARGGDWSENIVSLPRTRGSNKGSVWKRGLRARWSVAGAAAALILTVLVSMGHMGPLLGIEHYETSIGEQRSLVLPDGSHVQLNVLSTLSAKVNSNLRDVRLEGGEALFQVAKDPSRPFRVHTPDATIEAKGTQFNVLVRDGVTTVVLLEGHVLVQPVSGKSPTLLEPGQELRIASDRPVMPQPHKTDLQAVTAWTEHRLVFEDAPLQEVVAEFNRYNRQPLLIEDPTLRAVRITASFDAANAQTFADTLAAAGRLHVTRSADGTWLIGR